MKRHSGFSLLELLIVIAILSDLMVVAMPSFMRSRQYVQDSRFMNDLRTAVDGFETYAAEHSSYPAATAPGVVPSGMQPYLGGMDWGGTSAIGGQWQWDNNTNGTDAAVGVLFPTAGDDVRMAEIDERIDNGILTTGGFRKKSSTLYSYIIE